jgi:hypothetical protein
VFNSYLCHFKIEKCLFFLPIQIEKNKFLENEKQVGKMEANNTTGYRVWKLLQTSEEIDALQFKQQSTTQVLQ